MVVWVNIQQFCEHVLPEISIPVSKIVSTKIVRSVSVEDKQLNENEKDATSMW